jgi:hypothetical protein
VKIQAKISSDIRPEAPPTLTFLGNLHLMPDAAQWHLKYVYLTPRMHGLHLLNGTIARGIPSLLVRKRARARWGFPSHSLKLKLGKAHAMKANYRANKRSLRTSQRTVICCLVSLDDALSVLSSYLTRYMLPHWPWRPIEFTTAANTTQLTSRCTGGQHDKGRHSAGTNLPKM